MTQGKTVQDTMKALSSYHLSMMSKLAWQSWLKLHCKWSSYPNELHSELPFPSARLNSTKATVKRQAVMAEIEQIYLKQLKEARAWFDRLLVHYNNVVLPKDDQGDDC